jgi:heptosyltransferase II
VKPPRKILIVGPSWVGDMIMAQSLYMLLRSRHPDAELHVLAPSWSKPVLDRMPEVASAIEHPLGHGELGLGSRRRLGRELRAEQYDQAIVLPRSLKSSLIPFFASIPVRTGFRGEWRYGLLNDIRPFDPGVLNQTVKRFVALGLEQGEEDLPPIPEPELRVERQSLAQTLERFNLDRDSDCVALMPGAEYGPAKQWPPDYFAGLASRLAGVGVRVLILGSQKEKLLGDEILAGTGSHAVRNLCGETSLGEAADILSYVNAAVSNDSGLMHMAAAVKTQVVGLYGSSTPKFTPPLTANKHLHYLNLECSPCFKRVCPLGHFRCMREISIDAVCSSVVTALGGSYDDQAI